MCRYAIHEMPQNEEMTSCQLLPVNSYISYILGVVVVAIFLAYITPLSKPLFRKSLSALIF